MVSFVDNIERIKIYIKIGQVHSQDFIRIYTVVIKTYSNTQKKIWYFVPEPIHQSTIDLTDLTDNSYFTMYIRIS